MSLAELFYAKHPRRRSPARRPKRSLRRARRLLFEPLESRLLLAGDPTLITALQQTELVAGLTQVAAWGGQVENHAEFAALLPAVNLSLGAALDVDELLEVKLLKPVSDYFAANPSTATVGGLQTVLDGLTETVGAVTASVSADEVGFTLNFQATHTTADVPLALGPGANALGLTVDPTDAKVDLTAKMALAFSFGLDLTPPPVLGTDPVFFMRVQSFTANADVHESLLDFDAQIGLLDLSVEDATIDLDADLSVVLHNPDADPDGNVTRGELAGTAISDLVSVTATGALSGTLPVAATLGSFTTEDGSLPAIILADAAVFDGVGPSVTPAAELGELQNFRNATPADIVALLDQLTGTLGLVGGTGVFDVAVPLVQDAVGDPILLSGFLDPSAALATKLAGLEDAQSVPTFDSAQALGAKLATLFGLTAAQIDADYDPTTDALSYHVKVSKPVSATVKTDFSADLGPLADLVSADDVGMSGTATFELDFGIKLSPPAGPGDTLVKRFFVEDAALDAALTLSFTSLPLSGRLGFLGFTSSNGSGTVSPTVEVALHDPTTAAARVSLFDLAAGVANPAALASSTVDGTGSLTLANVGTNGFLTLGAAPVLTVTIADAGSLGAATVSFNAAAMPMAGFAALDFADVTAALQAAAGPLGVLAGLSGLSQADLPLVDVPLAQLLNLVSPFSQARAAIAANPVDTVQELEDAIEDALGLPAGDDPSVKVAYDAAAKALRIDLDVLTSALVVRPLNLDLASLVPSEPKLQALSNVIGNGANGNVQAALSSTFALDLGIDLATPATPAPFLYDTTALSVGARITATGLDFSTAAGPVVLFIKNGTVTLDKDGAGGTTDPATFKVTLADEADNRYLPGEVVAALATLAVTGKVDATLPLFSPTASTPLGGAPPANQLHLTIGDLGDIANTTAVTTPDLQAPVAAVVVNDNLGSTIEGFDRLLAMLQDALDSDLAHGLPLVGDNLADAAQFIEGMRDDVTNALHAKLDPAGSDTADLVREALLSALGPAGLKLLGELDGVAGISKEDILLPVNTSDEARFHLKLHQTIAEINVPVDFDIGIPALKLSVAPGSKITILVGFDWDITFGVSRADGFYLDTSAPKEMDLFFNVLLPDFKARGTLAFLTLTVTDEDADNNLANNYPVNGDPNHRAADLDIDGVRSSLFEGSFAIDIGGAAGDGGRVTFGELGTGEATSGNLLTASLTATADINLQLDLTFDDKVDAQGNPDSDYPSLRAQFALDWSFSPITGVGGGVPFIAFNDVQLRLGDFFDTFVGPIVKGIHDVLDPVAPVINFLTEPIPVVSDLADLVGKGPVTLAKLAGDVFPFLKPVQIALEVADQVLDIHLDAGNTFLDLGSFNLNGPSDPDVRTLADLTGLSPNIVELVADLYTSVRDELKDMAAGTPFAAAVDNLFDPDNPNSLENLRTRGLHFPLFDNPLSAFDLILGKTVDLVTFDPPPLDLHAKLPQSGLDIAPSFGPLTVGIGGQIDIFADFFFGFDTEGLTEFVKHTDHPEYIFTKGFYIKDLGPSGADLPEISIKGNFGAFAEASLLVFKAKVFGGITATIDANLNDPNHDGRVRFDEIAAQLLDDPLCVFDVAGSIDAGLDVTVKVEVDALIGTITLFEKKFVIAHEVLHDLTNECEPVANPNLATLTGDVLRLNVGDTAGLRGTVGQGETNEVYLLVLDDHGTPAAADDKILVKAFGQTQEFLLSAVARIEGDPKAGNDSILVDGRIGKPVIFHGGEGDDTLGGGGGDDQLFGENGADTLIGRGGKDTLEGGAADDLLQGEAGDDVLRGGAQNDFLGGGAGNDRLEGGADNDTAAGDTGNDTIEGGAGNDALFGEADNDSILGGAGTDTLGGGFGQDILIGGDQADRLFGDEDADILAGDNATVASGQVTLGAGTDGDDTVIGGDGADRMWGQGGKDVMAGDVASIAPDGQVVPGGSAAPGNDTMLGGAGSDRMFGQGGNDSIEGGADSDVIFGGVGNDRLIGGSSTAAAADPDAGDTVFGEEGDDVLLGDNGIIGSVTLIGGAGNDSLVGGAGADLLYGQGGDDTLEGGTQNDTLVGGQGGDIVSGQDDQDSLEGGAGFDFVFGGAGADDMIGGLGALSQAEGGLDVGDFMFGDAGDDVILGDNGTISAGTRFVQTTSSGGAGVDLVFGGEGNDVIFGGGFGDLLVGDAAAGTGNDVIVGDQGTKDAGKIEALHSAVADSGGNDLIFGSGGADTLLGGDGADTIDGSAGADIILGDNGVVSLASGLVTRIATTAGSGGNDLITGGTAFDIALGGDGDDTIDGGPDAAPDILLGDNGVVARADGTADANDIFSTDPTIGGRDTITGGGGADILVGGSGGLDNSSAAPGDGDSLTGGDGDDIALGDNGRITRDSLERIQRIATTFPGNGGDDTITGGQGADTLLGGFGGDSVQGGTEADVILGDNGLLDYVIGDPSLLDLDLITTTNPTLGASDILEGQDGNDTVMGGTAGETIHGGNGDDLLFGDHGKVDLDLPADRNFFSVDTGALDGGAADEVHGDSGRDTILGGQAGDLLLGEADDDDLIGGHNVPGGSDAGDVMDGGAGNDALAGDNASIIRRLDTVSPLVRALSGTTLYGAAGAAGVTGASQANPTGAVGRDIILFDHSDAPAPGTFGNDTMAGGAQNDTVLGQLGDDLIQGDASTAEIISFANGVLNPSIGAASDGDDYIEGNGGADLIFGDFGQDDILGGSSDLFGLTTAALRPDGADVIFGGAGTETGRNHLGDLTNGGHARDADVIIGDNGRIFRIVGTNAVPTAAFLIYNYDNYLGGLRIIPRAVDLLDYTPGATGAGDRGAGDLIHGEAGDDSLWGVTGNDVLYGEGQDDDVLGGAGNDWASGGTGDDAVLGDDGKVITSRNGLAEPLAGVAALPASQLNLAISTPGSIQQATINVAGQLRKAVDLEPFDLGGDDVLYGGLGNDSMHGGGGDDAMSGAEALILAATKLADGTIVLTGYDTPVNVGGMLAFNPVDVDGQHPEQRTRAGEFLLYDEYNPLKKITLNSGGQTLEFFLNVPAADAAAPFDSRSTSNPKKRTDGDDKMFGDVGNDWIVGGTGRDDLYGGYGNDLLQADDDLSTNGGLNTIPDTDPSYEDRAFGGAGRDILIANTGGDRLIDWVGEFNSYLVPFAPFGMATVSRTLQPQLAEFLYALSASDGVDLTRAADTGADPARNGEPFGELGLVRQQDFDWHDQTGAPSDPQAGNLPGGKRDVLRTSSFNDGQLQGFFVDSGKFSVSGGVLQVAANSPQGDAVAVYGIGEALPTYYEMLATIKVIKPTAGWKADAFLVFDYVSKTDFKFAGIDISLNKLVIGHRTSAGWVMDKQTPFLAKPDTFYNMTLAVNGLVATISVNNTASLTFTFQPRVVAGYAYGLNWGLLGVGSDQARGAFDNVTVQVAPATTFQSTEDFADGVADRFTGETAGSWTVTGGRYVGTPLGGATAYRLMNLGVTQLGANSRLDLSTVVNTQGRAGFVFDFYSPDDFKFVAIDAPADQVVVGHYRNGAWVKDVVVSNRIDAGVDYTLAATLKGSTVSVTLNGQAVLGAAFNGVTVDGGFGLLATGGAASFDSVTVKTDDAGLAPPSGGNLEAAAAPAGPAGAPSVLAPAQLDSVLSAAAHDWIVRLGADPRLAALAGVRVSVTDLPDGLLGQARGQDILIDADGAGYGWFLGSPVPAGRMDLLEVMEHELGHVLGFAHEEGGVMASTLAPDNGRASEAAVHRAVDLAGVTAPEGRGQGLLVGPAEPARLAVDWGAPPLPADAPQGSPRVWEAGRAPLISLLSFELGGRPAGNGRPEADGEGPVELALLAAQRLTWNFEEEELTRA